MKRVVKETLAENCKEVIAVEKDFRAIEFIIDIEPSKDSKYMGKRSQPFSSKSKDKEFIDLEILSQTIKSLSNKLKELKQRSCETTVSSKPHKLNFLRRDANFGSSNNHLAKCAQIQNVVFNIESMGIDQYCLFHQEYHSRKTCPQWNHSMNTLDVHIIDTILSDDQNKLTKERKKLL